MTYKDHWCSDLQLRIYTGAMTVYTNLMLVHQFSCVPYKALKFCNYLLDTKVSHQAVVSFMPLKSTVALRYLETFKVPAKSIDEPLTIVTELVYAASTLVVTYTTGYLSWCSSCVQNGGKWAV